MAKYLLVANWKMNCDYSEAMELGDYYKSHLGKYDGVDLVVLPPAIWMESLTKKFSKANIAIGAQNIHYEKKGAFTGEMSVFMVKKFVKYVLVGHSERRNIFGETNEAINRKVKLVLANNLKPIICFGENSKDEGIDHILAQISQAISGVSKKEVNKILFAYEPVWAIGTGKVATVEHARLIINSARERLAVIYGRDVAKKCKFLYGGSVHSKNIQTFLGEKDINGFLAGGASLDTEVFGRIYQSLKV